MIKTEIVTGDELPYRVEIDERYKGAAETPARAVIAALSVGNLVPRDISHPLHGYTYLPWYYMEVARYLFWNYESTEDWAKLIHILCHDSFETM